MSQSLRQGCRRVFGRATAVQQQQRWYPHHNCRKACTASAAAQQTTPSLLEFDGRPFIGPIQVVQIEGDPTTGSDGHQQHTSEHAAEVTDSCWSNFNSEYT